MPRRFEALDGMRGLCAVIVALMHFDIILGTGVVVRHGWLSVDMFFVLSGFVIALKYEERLQAPNGFRAFMGARAARLLPVQFLGTTAVAMSFLAMYLMGYLAGVNLVSLGEAYLYGLLLIPISWSPLGNIFPYLPRAFPINTPLWSLQAEWIVNIIYARWLSSAKTRLLFLLWAILVLCLATHVLLGGRTWDFTKLPSGMIAGLGRAAVGFIAGVLVYRMHRRRVLAWLPSINPRAVFAIWFLICMIPPGRPTPILESVAAIIVAPLSVALLIRGERPLPRLYTGLGALSYPLYASHFVVFNLAAILFAHGPVRYLSYIFPMLIAALLLAWGINRLAIVLQTHTSRVLSYLRTAPAAPSL